MKIAIVGGGINGLCCAWLLALKGHHLRLYERDKIMRATSCSSSKLLHGGLRYLENREFRLVREALRERDAWLKRAPELTRPLRLVMPIYQGAKRSRFKVACGLFFYDRMANKSSLPPSEWLNREELLSRDSELNPNRLQGGYEFSDAQMDDYALGLWVAEQARAAGVEILENTIVTSVTRNGQLVTELGGEEDFDRVVNVAGPWAMALLYESGINIPYRLKLVRGSHLLLARPCAQSYLLEVPGERRIVFVLPWKGKTLLGTTEVCQSLDEPVQCSEVERNYLLSVYHRYRRVESHTECDVEDFSGLRPLLYNAKDVSRTTREYLVHRTDKLVTVLGGKWTTSLALAEKVSVCIDDTSRI